MPKPTLETVLAKKAPEVPSTPSPSAGRPVRDDDGKTTTSLRLDREKLVRLKAMAVRQRRRVNDVIIEAIDNHLALHEDKAA